MVQKLFAGWSHPAAGDKPFVAGEAGHGFAGRGVAWPGKAGEANKSVPSGGRTPKGTAARNQ